MSTWFSNLLPSLGSGTAVDTNSGAPVKNTFIHYGEEQPSALDRKCFSDRPRPRGDFADVDAGYVNHMGMAGHCVPPSIHGHGPGSAAAPVDATFMGHSDGYAHGPLMTGSSMVHPPTAAGVFPGRTGPLAPCAGNGVMDESSFIDNLTAEAAKAEEKQMLTSGLLADLESDEVIREPQASQSGAAASGMTVKNTFIHYDCADQPSIFDARKTASGPAFLNRIGEEFMPAAKSGSTVSTPSTVTPHDGVNGVMWPPYTTGTAVGGPGCSPESGALGLGTSQWPAQPPGPSASVGSAGHDKGDCRPCAHNWRPGGCAKGYSCTFCHMCEEGVLKQRKKDKISRIRADRRQKARQQALVETSQDGAADGSLPGLSPSNGLSHPSLSSTAMPALQEASAAEEAEALADSSNGSVDQPCAEGSSKQSAGELTVDYTGDKGEDINVRWFVDLKKLRAQHRCGMSRRFNLRLAGQEVPFLINLAPDGGNAADTASSFRKPDVLAVVQIKCTDVTALTSSSAGADQRFNVLFIAGGLPARQVSLAHDFAAEPLCALPPREALWDLATAAGGKDAATCVIQVLLRTASEASELTSALAEAGVESLGD
eukprot:TRINITY_DN60903_c0_g1_i1.p1 TRINITY_DN60903_c0_g1~~TRINITY_DN60903_c0_g1_i1.p1  ORF type:complete len:599 (+),score=124.68 TRINITY_DN60903_c0_g1_i1:114-1910(+)